LPEAKKLVNRFVNEFQNKCK